VRPAALLERKAEGKAPSAHHRHTQNVTSIKGLCASSAAWPGQMPGPPQPQPFVQPTGLSCTGPAECVAVGNDGRTLAEIWVGAHWQITPTPSP